MSRSIKGLLPLFESPRSYRILMSDSSEATPIYIDLKDPRVEVIRHNDTIEILDCRDHDARQLITIPMTRDAIAKCHSIAFRLNQLRTTLLTKYEICHRAISPRHLAGGECIVAEIAIQSIPKGEILSRYIVDMEYRDIPKIHDAIDGLEAALKSVNISFSKFTPESIIVDKAGFLYPFGYKNILIDQDPEVYCQELRGYISYILQQTDVPDRCPTPSPYADRPVDSNDYIECGDLHEDRIAVLDAMGYGYIDSTGEVVIPAQYLWADSFREGRAEVQGEDGYGIIDTDGRIVVPLSHESIAFNVDTAIVTAKMGGKWCYYDYNGNQLTPYIYDCPNEGITRAEIEQMNK